MKYAGSDLDERSNDWKELPDERGDLENHQRIVVGLSEENLVWHARERVSIGEKYKSKAIKYE